MSLQRFVRFISKDDGKTYYGAADEALQFANPLETGSPFSPTTQIIDKQHGIQKLLCPIDIDHARSVVCIELNYTDHAEEAKMPIPKVPVVLAWQLEPRLGGGQWCYSKCFDSSAPIGPAIVSKDILGSAVGLGIWGTLNRSQLQNGNANNMIFFVAEIVSFLSQGMTLLPGTLIFTGTPAGVGFGRKPQISMKEGDIIKVEIDGIGAISNKVVYEQ
ncbi:hypothetical protein IL306_003816 [Fusarium sp. DS 682]|nr:hypothetical protein IL306_003816 [Fusarium sp. DS 682]